MTASSRWRLIPAAAAVAAAVKPRGSTAVTVAATCNGWTTRLANASVLHKPSSWRVDYQHWQPAPGRCWCAWDGRHCWTRRGALQCGAGVLDRAVEALDSHLAVTVGVDAHVDQPETTRTNLPVQMHLHHTASSHITSTPGAVASPRFGSTGGGKTQP